MGNTVSTSGAGRPPKGTKKRVKRVNVSFSQEEYKRVEAACKSVSDDISLTAFVRRCALLMSEELS